jgi:hypothetical protein
VSGIGGMRNRYEITATTPKGRKQPRRSYLSSENKITVNIVPQDYGMKKQPVGDSCSKTVDKKDIVCIVSNTGIYTSKDKVGTLYLA